MNHRIKKYLKIVLRKIVVPIKYHKIFKNKRKKIKKYRNKEINLILKNLHLLINPNLHKHQEKSILFHLNHHQLKEVSKETTKNTMNKISINPTSNP